ncbi:MAG TPA: tyrosine-type recombinase/integrase [Acidimicrobiia bacterium]|nr:tyrosine-type recombinase/integrase [Acidimicrobiia bacterium]
MATDSLPIPELLDSFELHLRAKNRSPKTIHSYKLAVDQLIDRVGHKPADQITKADIEGFLAHFLETRASATARQRYASLKQFFKWAAGEGEIPVDPMATIDPPRVVEQPVPVLTVDQLRALLKACGNDFEGRRDEAIIRLFADTGMRLGEMAGLRVQDVDLSLAVAIVKGKGSRFRTVPYGDRTAAALDRYRRQRIRHDDFDSEWWWLGRKGPLSSSGINQLLKRRAADAGLDSLHAHMFRHSFAHQWLSAGGNEGDLQRIAGWSSPQMLQRYGRSAADQRAREAYRRNPLWGDL